MDKDKLAFVKKYITNDNEFSKRFTMSIRNFMFFHVGITIIAGIVLAFVCIDVYFLIDILSAMMPVYIALQGANYVKSGFENWKKIGSTNSPTSKNECENG